MHPNPIFHDADNAHNISFARARAFGILAVSAEDGPQLSHIPFLLNADATCADLHLVRSNPIARMGAGPHRAKIIVSGPDSYVSPDWYGAEDQVPTWNYVAVHLAGTLQRLPQEDLRDVLDRQSAFYEDQLKPKTPWVTSKMTPESLEKMMRMIVPFRFAVTRVDGTWKLGQNKPDAVRLSAAEEMAQNGIGSEIAELARMMHDLDHH